MLAAEIASTTAKPSMILARNRRVGNLKDEPPRFKNRTPHPVFVLKNRHREALPPNPVRKVKAEWIRVRKFGQSWQRRCRRRLLASLGGVQTSKARSWVGSHERSEMRAGWSDLSTRALLDVERPSTHPALRVDPRASFIR